MSTVIDFVLREQLLSRRDKLNSAAVVRREDPQVFRLLKEVDNALERIEKGSYGLCKTCHDPIEAERLLADPLVQFCIDDLSLVEQTALEEDLKLASTIQRGLLPNQDFHYDGWEIKYHYEGLGLVSGDYCDLVRSTDGYLYFILGDVSGKGVAASMLMAHLHAMFRALISVGLPLNQLVERASRVFCESTMPTQFATLVCGRTNREGETEICNAGHLSPLLIQGNEITRIEATGLPIGMFSNEEFSIKTTRFLPGDTMLLFTDGLSEATDPDGNEYGTDRLAKLACDYNKLQPKQLIDTCQQDLAAFRSGTARTDDLAIMAIQRVN